ncbi:hypothetical protein C447_13764 [Halococcus hamelinensis 100A6]|uniref:Uncharacterized protein n=1 Tax=Halococcus hamelinensis 100A6 TaxID=1132509 RepID=M0LT94_9EURY|nr:hypothetical protein C447_13764 [Halococcus hamelinensis 100A6]
MIIEIGVRKQTQECTRSIYSGLLLRRIAQYLGYDPPEEDLLELLLAAAIDPNPHRLSLIEAVQHGAFVRELA